MKKLQPLNQLLDQLHVPVQDLAQLSFCDGSRESSFNAWTHSLPLTQIQFVSGLLYQALPEVNRFQTNSTNRLALLEALRRPTYDTVEGLSQSFLNQPLILPASAVKTATIAQALQKHLVSGYLAVVHDLCKSTTPSTEVLAMTTHRAIVGFGQLLLRYYQLYLPISAQIWTELHSLYQIAVHFNLDKLLIEDNLFPAVKSRSIKDSYIRILLLACARPNQLRQFEIVASYDALDTLSHLAELQEITEENRGNLFAVALNSNHPPRYRSRFSPQNHKLLLELNTAAVCAKLNEAKHSSSGETDETANRSNSLNLTPALTQHLVQAYKFLALRNFDRKEVEGRIKITVGLTNIHFHMAGKVNFTHFLNKIHAAVDSGKGTLFQRRDTPIKPTLSISTGSDTIEDMIRQKEDSEYKDTHQVYEVALIDTSPGGYCVEWRDEIPTQVKAGELLGLDDNSPRGWSLGVVRWVNQIKGATQLGIQVLAPLVTPIGIAVVQKAGVESEYLRGLEIPALKAINQPTTIITNAISFHEYTKAKVYYQADNDEGCITTNIQLTRRLFATGSFSQFTFRSTSRAQNHKSDLNDDFDAVWDS